MEIQFQALDYRIDGAFEPAEYKFEGSVENGWLIRRNRERYLKLGSGYKLLQNLLCGVCATDLARRFLPFPLPQVIGHEVVAVDRETMQKSVVEINDTSYYRGDSPMDLFSREGLYTHTPGRMVLGIDRLPGGFGPWLLAPQHSIIPTGALDDYTAVLIEPFAAAFHAVLVSPPRQGDSVAVLGPRRLGSLLVAALNAFRNTSGIQFEINAVARHTDLLALCRQLGADRGIDLREGSSESRHRRFDIVYDTTGTESGFLTALQMAGREIHLKSTSGQPVAGFQNLTALVVDELSILPYDAQTVHFSWQNATRENEISYAAPGARIDKHMKQDVHQLGISDAVAVLQGPLFQDRLPHFDLAVASSVAEIDAIIRPVAGKETALVRPRGAILVTGKGSENPLLAFIQNGGRLRTSRCGEFKPAISVLQENSDLAAVLSQFLISHVFPASELSTAFQYAAKSSARKVVVKHL